MTDGSSLTSEPHCERIADVNVNLIIVAGGVAVNGIDVWHERHGVARIQGSLDWYDLNQNGYGPSNK